MKLLILVLPILFTGCALRDNTTINQTENNVHNNNTIYNMSNVDERSLVNSFQEMLKRSLDERDDQWRRDIEGIINTAKKNSVRPETVHKMETFYQNDVVYEEDEMDRGTVYVINGDGEIPRFRPDDPWEGFQFKR